MFKYKQLQKVFVYLKRYMGKELHHFKVSDEDEPEYLDVEDDINENGGGRHPPNSPIMKYEDVVIIELQSANEEFKISLKMYSKHKIGFAFFISYNPDGDIKLHEKFAETNYVWDNGVSGYQLMEYSDTEGEMGDAEVGEIFQNSLKEVLNEIENILKL